MNILFAGSPTSSSKILKYLAGLKEVHIKGAITQPDKRGKRGADLKDSEVSKVASALNLRVLKPISLDDKIFRDEIESLDIDFLVVVDATERSVKRSNERSTERSTERSIDRST